MHFYDDGLFIGQFGEASNGHPAQGGAVPGFAGNAFGWQFVKTLTGDYYLWQNDESAHGVQRWHFINARNIREQVGAGTLGTTIRLTNQECGFPVGLVAANSNRSATLSWQQVRGATSYNIYYSLINGGPYSVLAANTTNIQFLLTGLTNGHTYYCAVTAISASGEGIPSEQVELNPFDTSQVVLCVGSLAESGQWTPVIDVSSNAVSSNQPSFLGSEHLTGVLTPSDLAYYGYGALMNKTIGVQGYLLYDWGGAGTNLTNLSPSLTVTMGSGWVNLPYLSRQYRVNGILGTNWGLSANPVGTINIAVNDANFHFLTVVSPAISSNARDFTLGITSTNGTSAQYAVNEPYGCTHTFQFLFKGNITLQANATGGNWAIVQGLFLDGSPFYNLLPPNGLHIVSP